jgi:hypothetical protein
MTPARINLRAATGQETVSLEALRYTTKGTIGLSIAPDSPLDAGYEEAFARLDTQSLGRLLHWLQTGEALPRDDPRIPQPFQKAT